MRDDEPCTQAPYLTATADSGRPAGPVLPKAFESVGPPIRFTTGLDALSEALRDPESYSICIVGRNGHTVTLAYPVPEGFAVDIEFLQKNEPPRVNPYVPGFLPPVLKRREHHLVVRHRELSDPDGTVGS